MNSAHKTFAALVGFAFLLWGCVRPGDWLVRMHNRPVPRPTPICTPTPNAAADPVDETEVE